MAQLVARLVRDQEAVGSNPVCPNLEKDLFFMEENTVLMEEIKEICSVLAKIQDDKLIYDFFECLFTKSELKDFSKRWSLVKELEAGTPQREIAKKYNLSLCNITRGSKEMKKEDSAFKKILSLRDENQ